MGSKKRQVKQTEKLGKTDFPGWGLGAKGGRS